MIPSEKEFEVLINDQWDAANELLRARGITLSDREWEIINMLFINMIAQSTAFREGIDECLTRIQLMENKLNQ